MRRRGRTLVRRCALGVLVALVTTACLRPTLPGTAQAAERIDAAAGVPVVDLSPPTSTRPSDDALVGVVLADLNTYWAAVLPRDFGRPLAPLRGGYQAIDSSATATAPGVTPLCHVTAPDMVGNAYYCPGDDGVVVDTGVLVPVLLAQDGPAGLITSLAHEFGHAIQARIGPTDADRVAQPTRYPSLVIENGGDCSAGAFLSWVVAGHAPHLHLGPASLVRAVAPLLDYRDPVDTSPADTAAHGLSLDRLRAFLAGFRGGPTVCPALHSGWDTPTLGHRGVSTAESVARYPSEAAVLDAARTSIAAFPAGPAPAPASPANGPTGGVPLRSEPTATAAPADLAVARPIGQFAVAAALALSEGRVRYGTAAGAACFTGAWTASVFGAGTTGLGSWAGDADEALDLLRGRPGATFDELAGYADGFDRGVSACAR